MSDTITIKEFRMWLEGVEEMQDDGWVPDAKQWKRIRQKLDTVDEAEAPAPQPMYERAYAPAPGPMAYDPQPFAIPAMASGPTALPTALGGNPTGQMNLGTGDNTTGAPYVSVFN